jgi:hypothetical protein
MQTQVGLLDTDPPETQPHLNHAGPGVEAGGPWTFGGRGVGGATATIAAITVMVILLLVGLLQLLLLTSLLVLLMSWLVFLPTGRGRGQQRLLHGVESCGGGGSDR